MKRLLLTLGLMVVAVPAASAAVPAGTSSNLAPSVETSTTSELQRRYRNREVRQERRECRRELRRAENRRQFNRELRECRRELARARASGRWDRWDNRWRRW